MPEHVGNVHVDEANEVGLLALLLDHGPEHMGNVYVVEAYEVCLVDVLYVDGDGHIAGLKAGTSYIYI